MPQDEKWQLNMILSLFDTIIVVNCWSHIGITILS